MSPLSITLLPAYNPGPLTGAGNNTYLVGAREPVLIDAGTGDPRHLDELARALAATGARLSRVLVTHAHADHASGCDALAARWPDLVFAKMPWVGRDERYRSRWQPLADGDGIAVDDSRLIAIHTPGHAPDHLAFWHTESRTLFSGDLVVSGTTVVVPAGYGGSLVQYLSSLERVLALDPARLLPAHGPEVAQPADLVRRYLAHRQQREEQVIAALRNGCRTPSAIVGRLYSDLSAELRDVARESVTAHLIKLEAEGRASREGDHWRLTIGDSRD